MRYRQIEHAFVEYVPDALDDGVLYVSIPFAAATHKCFCGCGWEVTTPIAPNAWELTFNGRSVSLNPSVGSKNLRCKSHYWIRENNVDWLLPFVDPWPRYSADPAEQESAATGSLKRFLHPLMAIRDWLKKRG